MKWYEIVGSYFYCILLGAVVACVVILLPYFIGTKFQGFKNATKKTKTVIISLISVLALALITVSITYVSSAFRDSVIKGVDRNVYKAGETYLNTADSTETRIIQKAQAGGGLIVSSAVVLIGEKPKLASKIDTDLYVARKTSQNKYFSSQMWSLTDSNNELLFSQFIEELVNMPAMAVKCQVYIDSLKIPSQKDAKAYAAYQAEVTKYTNILNTLNSQFSAYKNEFKKITDVNALGALYERIIKANDKLLAQTTTISIKLPSTVDTIAKK